MRNPFGVLFLILSVGLLCDCGQKTSRPSYSSIPLSTEALLDSIANLDSLVNVVKNSSNHQANVYSRLALSIALRMNSAEALSRAYLMMGVSYVNHRDDSSYYYYSEALRLAERFRLLKLKPYIFYNLSMLYNTVSNTKMTVILLDSTIKTAGETGNYELLSNAYNALGNINYDLKEYSEAEQLFNTSLKIAKNHSLLKQTGVALAGLSRFETSLQSSINSQKEAIRYLGKARGTEEEIAFILINIGTLYTDADTAMNYYKRAIRLGEAVNSEEVRIAAYNNLAYSYLDKKNYKEAASCLIDKAIPLALNGENLDWLATLYDSYAEVLYKSGKPDSAYTYEKKAMGKRAEADSKQGKNQVRLLAALLDTRSKEMRIQSNEKELLKKDNRMNKMIFWIILIAMITIIVILFLLGSIQRNKIKFQTKQVESAKRLIDLEENAKGRLAMELHDMTSPLYTSLLQQIEETEISNPNLKAEIQDKLSSLAANIRNISHSINKVFVEELTFQELLQGLCEDMQSLTIVPIAIEISDEEYNLSTEATIHLFRIVQELITNAVKYVKSGIIKLSISKEFNNLYLLYQDTGPGFNSSQNKNHGIGLLNIFERVKLLGGEAVLTSTPGNGTKWTISVPVSGIKN
jgi:two-component system, NarL family, sensor kinase